MNDRVTVRAARPDDLSTVLGVLDAAALATDHDRVLASIERGETLVAVRVGSTADADSAVADPGPTTADDGPILGALVLVGDEVDAVAVRRRRRDQGIGGTLVEHAADRRDRLVAEFDAGVCPFYEKLGFEIDPVDGSEDGSADGSADDASDGSERYRGVLDTEV